jgi:hypothetical protein
VAATYEWLTELWSDSSATLDDNGISRSTDVLIPLDAAVRRVIYARMARGALTSTRGDRVPRPASGNIEVTATARYGAESGGLYWNARSPLVWATGWALTGSLGGAGYWTWTTDNRCDFDMDLRRGAGIESAHQLVLNFEESVEFFDPTQLDDFDYPSYVSWTVVRILLSRPTA